MLLLFSYSREAVNDRRGSGSGVNQYIVENFFSVLNVDTRMNREHALNVMNFIGTAD